MAEITTQHKDSIKRKRLSTRVDLTPMVDLGFLLITFFIFTTKLSEAHALKLALPNDKSNDSSQAATSKTLNLVLGGDDKLWFYNGDSISQIRTVGYGPSGVRYLFEQKKRAITSIFGTAKDMVVLIKPTPESSYKNLVEVLDEILIVDIKTHVLMEPTKEEIGLIQNKSSL